MDPAAFIVVHVQRGAPLDRAQVAVVGGVGGRSVDTARTRVGAIGQVIHRHAGDAGIDCAAVGGDGGLWNLADS